MSRSLSLDHTIDDNDSGGDHCIGDHNSGVFCLLSVERRFRGSTENCISGADEHLTPRRSDIRLLRNVIGITKLNLVVFNSDMRIYSFIRIV